VKSFLLWPALMLLCPGLPLDADPETDLAEILRRLDADSAQERDRAQAELGRWCETTGAEAEALLRSAREGVSAEVRVRIELQLDVFERGRALRKELGITFDKAALPPVAGKKRVRFNAGRPEPDFIGPEESRFVHGWLLKETESAFELLEDDLRVHVRAKKLEFDPKYAEDSPAPGNIETIDFAGECRAWLENRASVLSGGGERLSAITLAYAWWASEAGLCELSLACHERVREDAVEYAAVPSFRGEASDLAPHWIALHLRSAADHSAAEGRPRAELLARWKGIAAIPSNPLTESAKKRVAEYESLVAEDEAWKEPSAEELAKADPATRARYWMHHFRDAVAADSDAWTDEVDGEREPKGPFDQLVLLGRDALPEIVAHLEDARPTRRIGFEDNHHREESYYLESCADGCAALVEKIGGVDLGDWARAHGMPIGGPDWRERRAKAAQAWWREEGHRRAK
jgi:hypothetical protein